jgi:hypothetical protein
LLGSARIAFVVLSSAASFGCERVVERFGGASSGPHEQGTARIGGEVVSTVDGVAITVADVQRIVDATGMQPREALHKLQSEALLIGEAERRGYSASRAASHVKVQAEVQAFLAHDIESVRATEEEIRAELVRQKARFEIPEKRQSLHVLALLPKKATPAQDKAAHDFIAEICRAFGTVDDPEIVLADVQARSDKPPGVRVEHLPAVANDGSFVQPFLDAMFSLPAPGPVPTPVKTEYGWHAIVLTKIIAPVVTPKQEARAAVTTEIETRKRKVALDALIARLRSDVPVVTDASGEKALATLEF